MQLPRPGRAVGSSRLSECAGLKPACAKRPAWRWGAGAAGAGAGAGVGGPGRPRLRPGLDGDSEPRAERWELRVQPVIGQGAWPPPAFPLRAQEPAREPASGRPPLWPARLATPNVFFRDTAQAFPASALASQTHGPFLTRPPGTPRLAPGIETQRLNPVPARRPKASRAPLSASGGKPWGQRLVLQGRPRRCHLDFPLTCPGVGGWGGSRGAPKGLGAGTIGLPTPTPAAPPLPQLSLREGNCTPSTSPEISSQGGPGAWPPGCVQSC